jgi:hypothetical protein
MSESTDHSYFFQSHTDVETESHSLFDLSRNENE